MPSSRVNILIFHKIIWYCSWSLWKYLYPFFSGQRESSFDIDFRCKNSVCQLGGEFKSSVTNHHKFTLFVLFLLLCLFILQQTLSIFNISVDHYYRSASPILQDNPSTVPWSSEISNTGHMIWLFFVFVFLKSVVNILNICIFKYSTMDRYLGKEIKILILKVKTNMKDI